MFNYYNWETSYKPLIGAKGLIELFKDLEIEKELSTKSITLLYDIPKEGITDNAFDIVMEVPGVKRELISIEVDNNIIEVIANGRVPKHATIKIAPEYEASKLTAKLEDGILKLTIPKEKGKEKKRIVIL